MMDEDGYDTDLVEEDPTATLEDGEDYGETQVEEMRNLLGPEFADKYGDSLSSFDYGAGAEELEEAQNELQQIAEDAHEKTMESQKLTQSLKALGGDEDIDLNESMKGVTGKLREKARDFGQKLPDWMPGSGKLKQVGKAPSIAVQLQLRYDQLQEQHEYIGDLADEMYDQLDEWEEKREEYGEARLEALERRQAIEEELESLQNQREELEAKYEEADDDVEAAKIEQELDEVESEIRSQRKEFENKALAAKKLENMYESSGLMIEAHEEVAETADDIYGDLDHSLDQLHQVMTGGAQLGKVVEQLAETTKHYEDSKQLLNRSIKSVMESATTVKRARTVYDREIVEDETMESVRDSLDEMEEVDRKRTVEAFRESRSGESPGDEE